MKTGSLPLSLIKKYFIVYNMPKILVRMAVLQGSTTSRTSIGITIRLNRLPQMRLSGDAMVLGKLLVPGVLLIWIIVGRGPTTLALGAGGGCLELREKEEKNRAE